MSNTIFTDAGRALIASCLAEKKTLNVTELVFADVPNLDTDSPPNPAAGLPAASQIVHRAAPQAGLLNETTAVFATVIDADTGDFHINYMGVLAGSTLIAVCVMPRHLKFKTSEFKTGNSLVKNFAFQIKNVGELTGITVPAETWMWNFDDRFALIDHNHDDRYAAKSHAHTEYAAKNHTHTGYAAAGHNHDDKYEPKGAVSTHNGTANPHPGMFDAAGTATSIVSAHNTSQNPHEGVLLKRTNPTVGTGLKIDGTTPYIDFHFGNSQERTLRLIESTEGTLTVGGSLHINGTLTGGFNGSVATNGYTKLPNGLIIQWGVIAYTAGSQPVTFPVAFPTKAAAVTLGCSAGDSPTARYIEEGTLTKSGFTYKSGKHSGTYWIAVGY